MLLEKQLISSENIENYGITISTQPTLAFCLSSSLYFFKRNIYLTEWYIQHINVMLWNYLHSLTSNIFITYAVYLIAGGKSTPLAVFAWQAAPVHHRMAATDVAPWKPVTGRAHHHSYIPFFWLHQALRMMPSITADTVWQETYWTIRLVQGPSPSQTRFRWESVGFHSQAKDITDNYSGLILHPCGTSH